MKQIKFSVIIVPALILITAVAWFGWWLFPRLQQVAESPYKAIPPNAALIIRINNPIGFVDDLERSNLLWKEVSNLPGILAFREKVHVLDSMIRKNDALSQVTRKNPLLLSMVQTGSTSFNFLFLMAFTESNPVEKISRFIEYQYGDNASILINKYGAGSLIRITLKDKNESFFFAVRKGIFMGSFNSGILKKAIDQVSLNIPSILSTGFSRAEALTGKKVDANIFICYPMIYPFLVKQLQEDWFPEAYKSASFADWTGLDLHLKKDEILVNGYTTTTDSTRQFAGIYAGQSAQKINIPAILPENTSYFLFTGLSDVRRYYINFQAFALQKTGFLEQYSSLDDFQHLHRLKLADYLLPWIGNEMCFISTLPDPDKQDVKNYAVFRVKEPYMADSLLQSLRRLAGSRKTSMLVNNQPAFNLGIPNLIPGIFGKKYSGITGSFYTYVADYVVFANNLGSLEFFIDQYNTKKTLGRTREYMALTGHISDNANVYCYFNTDKNIGTIKTMLNDELTSTLEMYIDSLKKFESATIQLSNNRYGLHTSLFIHFNPASGKQGPLRWQTALDTTLTDKPQILTPLQAGRNMILVTDKMNTLYSIDAAGNIRWKIRLPGAPLGPVQPIFLSGQDSVCFLVNTRDQLCLINYKGAFTNKFPVKLASPATAGMSLTTVRDHEYRVFIPLADKKVHIYRIPLKWPETILDPGLRDEIQKPVQVLQSGKKDFVFITGKNGQVAITDLDGRPSVRTDKKLICSQNGQFYRNLTNKKGSFIADDPMGKIIYLAENGKTSLVSFNVFSPSHRFLYEDINKDGSWEFILYDKNKLYFYNRFFRLLYSYVFTRDITYPPYLINLPDGSRLIGVVSGPSGDIYLFGKEGIIKTDPGIHGNTAFDIGDFSDDGYWNLLIGAGKYLRSYRLPKE